MLDDPMLMAELIAAKRDAEDEAWRAANPPVRASHLRGLLYRAERWHAEYHGGRFEDCPAPTCSGEVPA